MKILKNRKVILSVSLVILLQVLIFTIYTITSNTVAFDAVNEETLDSTYYLVNGVTFVPYTDSDSEKEDSSETSGNSFSSANGYTLVVDFDGAFNDAEDVLNKNKDYYINSHVYFHSDERTYIDNNYLLFVDAFESLKDAFYLYESEPTNENWNKTCEKQVELLTIYGKFNELKENPLLHIRSNFLK